MLQANKLCTISIVLSCTAQLLNPVSIHQLIHQVLGVNTLEASSVVGIYPQGQSPYGLLGMAGNVAEWCLHQAQNPYESITEDVGDGFVERGGSFFEEPNNIALTTRVIEHTPDERGDLGFRVYCSKPIQIRD